VEIDPDFAPLVYAANPVELEMARGLLEGASIPFVVDASDRLEMLEVLEGAAAQGLQTVYVHRESLQAASDLLREAWGSETFEKRRAREG
jgi:hypothetical protein